MVGKDKEGMEKDFCLRGRATHYDDGFHADWVGGERTLGVEAVNAWNRGRETVPHEGKWPNWNGPGRFSGTTKKLEPGKGWGGTLLFTIISGAKNQEKRKGQNAEPNSKN